MSIFNLDNVSTILKGRVPKQLVIQFTDACNATCPQCGMRKSADFKRSKLNIREMKKIIDRAGEEKVQALSFTGGETFLYEEELLSLIKYASSKGIPLIRTGTNAFFLRDHESPDFYDRVNRLAENLSKTNLRNLWISIDSKDPQTHEKMRGLPGVIKGIEKSLPIFHSHGVYPAANLGINRNTGGEGKIPKEMNDREEFYGAFREAFKGFYEFIISLGFTLTNVCYPMNVKKDEELNPVYGATSISNIVSFREDEKVEIFKALKDTIPEYRDKIKIFTPLVSLYSLIKHYEEGEETLPCRGGIDFFFINAESGDTFPCGFRGNDNFGKFYEMDFNKIKTIPTCVECDWECFRDPSEQIGFLLEILKHPIKTIKSKDSEYKRLWKEDIKYYRKCNYFDGRLSS